MMQPRGGCEAAGSLRHLPRLTLERCVRSPARAAVLESCARSALGRRWEPAWAGDPDGPCVPHHCSCGSVTTEGSALRRRTCVLTIARVFWLAGRARRLESPPGWPAGLGLWPPERGRLSGLLSGQGLVLVHTVHTSHLVSASPSADQALLPRARRGFTLTGRVSRAGTLPAVPPFWLAVNVRGSPQASDPVSAELCRCGHHAARWSCDALSGGRLLRCGPEFL